MKLSELVPHLLYDFRSDDDLVRAVAEVSQKFTTDRDKINDYLKDPRLVSAYTAFYLLTNIPKLKSVLRWMPELWVQRLNHCDFIDLGAGPGTFSLAWTELGHGASFYQIEQSPLMREQGKRIWDAFSVKPLHQATHWKWQTDQEKFLVFGHSANEMSVDVALDFIRRINPEHILFIEPGTKEFFPKMLELRRELLNSGHQVLYPCPSAMECPMIGTDDWCHQFIHVKQDPEVERISQIVRLDRKLLPLTAQAFSRTFSTTNSRERIVRVFDETKYSFEWEVCVDNRLEKYQLMKRDLSKNEAKKLSSLLAGEAIQTELVKKLESTKRVRLKSE